MKTIITFGSDHLSWLKVNSMQVMLVVEAETEWEARNKVFSSKIGDRFYTSYPYHKVDEFIERHDMVEYSLKELLEMEEA